MKLMNIAITLAASAILYNGSVQAAAAATTAQLKTVKAVATGTTPKHAAASAATSAAAAPQPAQRVRAASIVTQDMLNKWPVDGRYRAGSAANKSDYEITLTDPTTKTLVAKMNIKYEHTTSTATVWNMTGNVLYEPQLLRLGLKQLSQINRKNVTVDNLVQRYGFKTDAEYQAQIKQYQDLGGEVVPTQFDPKVLTMMRFNVAYTG